MGLQSEVRALTVSLEALSGRVDLLSVPPRECTGISTEADMHDLRVNLQDITERDFSKCTMQDLQQADVVTVGKWLQAERMEAAMEREAMQRQRLSTLAAAKELNAARDRATGAVVELRREHCEADRAARVLREQLAALNATALAVLPQDGNFSSPGSRADSARAHNEVLPGDVRARASSRSSSPTVGVPAREGLAAVPERARAPSSNSWTELSRGASPTRSPNRVLGGLKRAKVSPKASPRASPMARSTQRGLGRELSETTRDLPDPTKRVPGLPKAKAAWPLRAPSGVATTRPSAC